MWENEWTTDMVIRLMQEYKQRPELWDTNHSLYRVHTAKYEAWSDLAQTFDCDVVDLRKKLNSIFASHRREKAKVRVGGKSTWFLYPYMKFLPSHIDNDNEVNVNTKNEYETQNDDDEQPSSENDDNDQEEVIVKQEPITTRSKRRYLPRKSHRSIQLKRPILKGDHNSTRQLDSKLIEALKLLKRSELSKRKDECDTFGEYIATSLRKHDERTQSMIKQAINNILFEQEMKKYSSGQYTVVLTGMEENPLVLGDQETDK